MNNKPCKIEWNTLPLNVWQDYFASVKHSNLLQSYEYAQAICPLTYQKPRWGLIKIEEQPAGLVQILEAGTLGNMLHTMALDRGPLWFDDYGDMTDQAAFFKALSEIYPRRWGRRRRILPELQDSPQGRQMMLDTGFLRRKTAGYQTIWLDLDKTQTDLRKDLRPKWRNMLVKAEKAGLELLCDETGAGATEFLAHYDADRRIKNYSGPSVKMTGALIKSFGAHCRSWIMTARLDKTPVAAILVLCHGQSATYQIGWSTDTGRDMAAHNYLLWQAICRLQDKQYRSFDLGGVNDETAKGVKKFKEGLGGQTHIYVGHYF